MLTASVALSKRSSSYSFMQQAFSCVARADVCMIMSELGQASAWMCFNERACKGVLVSVSMCDHVHVCL